MKKWGRDVVGEGEGTPVGKLNKGSFQYIRIWSTLYLVHLDRFCQHLIVVDADEKCDMAAVRDLE